MPSMGPRRTLKLAAIGTAAGMFSGLFGVGGGAIMVPALVVWCRYGEREAAAEEAVRALARRAEEEGLVTHWGRKVLEIRPPVALDKGRGVRRLIEETPAIETAAYVGDDTTDLDAFAALEALVDAGRLRYALRVGVRSDETPAPLEEQADLLVDGPIGVRALLHALAA